MMAIPVSQLITMQRRQALRLNLQITDQQLARVLRDAARDGRQMAAELANLPGGIGSITRQGQLRVITDTVDDISGKLWHNTGEITREGIFRMADLAAYQSMDLDRVLGMPISFIQGYEEGILSSARISAEGIIQRRQFGYTLSERVFRNEFLTSGRLHRIIESGLVNNLSARELSRQVGQFIDPRTRGGASYAAMRLARTEINNTHHWVSRDQYQNRPWIDSIEWRLSGSHPETDTCDTIADDGPYQTDEIPDKPHPQCLCFTIPVLPDTEEFLDSLLDGDYNDWLEENGRERISCHSSCKVTGDDGVSYQRLDTEEEQEEWLNENFENAALDLNDREIDAIDSYLSNSTSINQALRGDPRIKTWDERTISRITNEAGNLSRAIKKTYISEDIIAYRGVSENSAKRILKGNTFKDRGFSSTSLEQQIAEIFATEKDNGYVMEIQIPRGTRGLAIPEKFISEDLGISAEREIILDQGTTFEILSVDHIARKMLAKVVRK